MTYPSSFTFAPFASLSAAMSSLLVMAGLQGGAGGKLNIQIGSLSGIGNSGIYLQLVAGCGDVNMHIGLADVTSKAYNAVYIYNLSAVGVGTITVDYGTIRCESTDTAHHCLYGDGNTYQTANSSPGAFINILNGKLYRVQASSYLIRARDADIQLGAQVITNFTNFKTISGSGNAYRTSRAVATA